MLELMTKQDAIEYLLYMKHDVQAKSTIDIALDTAIEALKQPTIEPEVQHGRWIQSDALDYKDQNGVIHVHGMCSCCRMIYDFRDMTSRFKFCPNCGADMRKVEEDVGSKTD